jgi:hypothetical protein
LSDRGKVVAIARRERRPGGDVIDVTPKN